MPRRNVPIHNLRRNDTVWTPPAVICFDTETHTAIDGDNEILTMRLWSARYKDRRPPKGCLPRIESANGTSGEDLAHQVHEWTRGRRTVWMYAHNLHFDLVTSNLIDELRLLGWNVTDFAVDGGSPFVRMERGERNLTIADSWSWLPVALKDVGDAVNVRKPPLPKETDSDAAWLARCDSDVRILDTAIHALMNWWDEHQLGRWSITGGASGWNAMRHIPSTRRILIDPDPVRVEADRGAIYGGRRSVWRAGVMPPGRYAELDLEKAYTTVCRDLPLPCERMCEFTNLPITHPWLKCDRIGIIAEVLLDIDTPDWPVRVGRRVWYPVGLVWTTLAGPDIAHAKSRGILRQIGRGYAHKLGYALRPWAQWCLASMAEDDKATPDVAKITLRHWGRTVVGKWAQRGYERTQLGPAPTNQWSHSDGWNHTRNVRASIVDFGGWRWQVTASGDCDNAYPAILAFVESYVRVALARAIEVLSPDAMVACDTDGMIVDVRRMQHDITRVRRPMAADIPARKWPDVMIELANDATAPLRLRQKRVFHHVKVIGPQHMVLDGKRRYSGVPASAVADSAGKLTAQLWPKLSWQMANGRAGSYVRPSANYVISGTYAPGWVLANGSVVPVECRPGPDRTSQLLPWPWTRYARAGAQLAADQNDFLARGIDGKPATRTRTRGATAAQR